MNCHCCKHSYKQNVQTFTCTSCGHFFNNYTGDLDEFYRNYREETPLLKQSLRDKFTDNIISKISPYISPKTNVVCEVGAGDGVLLEKLDKMDYFNIYGFDIDPKMIEIMQSKQIPCELRNGTDLHDSTDVLMAYDVLEHISDIGNTVLNWTKLAKTVIIQIPANRRGKTEFKGHFHVFTEKSARSFFGQFREIKYFYTSKNEELSVGPAHLIIL